MVELLEKFKKTCDLQEKIFNKLKEKGMIDEISQFVDRMAPPIDFLFEKNKELAIKALLGAYLIELVMSSKVILKKVDK